MLPMLWAVAVTMDSIMKPVLGTPQGTGVGPIGGIATQTPTAKMFGYFGLRWCLSTMVKPRGLVRPSMPRHRRDAAEGRQHHREGEGQFLLAPCTVPSSAISSTIILPSSTFFTRARSST